MVVFFSFKFSISDLSFPISFSDYKDLNKFIENKKHLKINQIHSNYEFSVSHYSLSGVYLSNLFLGSEGLSLCLSEKIN